MNTVKTYIRGAYRKIGVQTRTSAVLWALGHGYGGAGAARVGDDADTQWRAWTR